MIDVCMDESMIDGEEAMRHFLNCAASDPAVSRVPFMIDSSKWSVIEAGLRCVQGKPVVNSISLKEGEEAFQARARITEGSERRRLLDARIAAVPIFGDYDRKANRDLPVVVLERID